MSKIGTKWESIKWLLHIHKHYNQVAPQAFCTYVAHMLHIIFFHHLCHTVNFLDRTKKKNSAHQVLTHNLERFNKLL